MPDLETLCRGALEFDEPDRWRLLSRLLLSLPGPEDAGAPAAWDDEIRRRVTSIEQGAAAIIPADEAFARFRATLRGRAG